MKLFLKILLYVFFLLIANVRATSATITFPNIQEATTSSSFHIEILKTVFNVDENDLANCCQSEQNLVDYKKRRVRVEARSFGKVVGERIVHVRPIINAIENGSLLPRNAGSLNKERGSVGGFISGFGTAMLPGGGGNPLSSGFKAAVFGGIFGGVINGVFSGASSATKGDGFWTGAHPKANAVSIQPKDVVRHQTLQPTISELQVQEAPLALKTPAPQEPLSFVRIATTDGKMMAVRSDLVAAKTETNVGKNVFTVTKEGVVLPKGAKIPSQFIQNPYRSSSYGILENGKFVEKLRIAPPTAPGFKGPNYSHFHLNGSGKHLTNWLWWWE